MSLKDLLSELGYRKSPFFRESGDQSDLAMAHLLRDAQRAGVSGTYFIRTAAEDSGIRRQRPAVHVAEAKTPEEARTIHRQLWNQGTTPFLLVSLPGQVRVYTLFAYKEENEKIGQIAKIDTNIGLREVANALGFLKADSIDSGKIWRTQGAHLQKNNRVDRALLENLRALSHLLVARHFLEREVAHALIGRLVYLYYLRDRGILSDQWLASAGVAPEAVFSSNMHLNAFRRLTDAVDNTFNGRIFPIDWTARSAPRAEAVREAGRAFAGENVNPEELPFRWTFDFSFIPIELLSAIYEQFLHDEGRGRKEGAFYTSEPVADYLLAEVESVRPLEGGMKVLDPCCGSGIFLVLAFRRLVEQELRRGNTNKLLATELRQILTSSIFGVERNPEACLVAEFSLTLALLSYVDPPELHRHTNFKFPTLHNKQIFEADFFSDSSEFWKNDWRFDWIVGNPPWVPLDQDDELEQPAISCIRRSRESHPVARFRSGEAFTWRVRERLSDRGVVGLITQATSLINEQSTDYRKAFFRQNTVHRITNFSNLAYDIFESSEEPAATLIYSKQDAFQSDTPILHFGPFKAHQTALGPQDRKEKRAAWAIAVYESEIQMVESSRAATGEGAVWRQALWGNPRDHRLLQRLRAILPLTLGDVADRRNWTVCRGVELRGSKGRAGNAVIAVPELEGLPLLDIDELESSSFRFSMHPTWLRKNRIGTFIRQRGGREGLKLIPGPHLFVCKDFAAFGNDACIFSGSHIGISAPSDDSAWLRAISVIWSSSIFRFYLFMRLGSSWGVGRSRIYAGDVRRTPIADLTQEQLEGFSRLHHRLTGMELRGESQGVLQQLVDDAVAAQFKLPSQLSIIAREFFRFRLPLIKGKTPQSVSARPDMAQLETYASRLKGELDGFLERRSRCHAVTVLDSQAGIIATIELTDGSSAAKAVVQVAAPDEQRVVRNILNAAEHHYGQWVYVRRSVRVFSGRKIHICKPARRLEWTETQAMLDAADIIAEVAEERGRIQ